MELLEAVESLKPETIEEKSVEVKEVTVKFNFTFENGVINDEMEAALYEMFVPKNDIIEESIDDLSVNESQENEFQS